MHPKPRSAPSHRRHAENSRFFEVSNWLSNRIFKSYDDIVDHCCFAWNNLVNQPWRIMSAGMRQWVHGS